MPNAGARTSDGLTSPDFSEVFGALPGLYLILLPDDPVYTIAAANDSYAEATGTDKKAITGRGLFDVFPDNPNNPGASGVRNLHASLRQVIATKARHTMAVQRYDIAGERGFEERYWSPVNTPVVGCDGQVRFIIHAVEDVTELVRLKSAGAEQEKAAGELRSHTDRIEDELLLRRRELADSRRLRKERDDAEKKLLAIEARFSLAFAQAPIGMLLISPGGKIVEVNQAFVDTLGYTREELIGRDSTFFTHPDDIAPTRKFFAALRKGPHTTGSFEKRYFRKDGELLWGRASAAMRRDEYGNPTQVIAIVEDITARKQAELRYLFLAESIPQMVWTAKPDGLLDYVNGQGRLYFGVEESALLGRGWLNFVHPKDQERTVELWSRSAESARPYETSFRLLQGNNGEWRWHLARALPFAGENGRIVQWFGTCTDIEDQRRTEEELRRTNRELEEFAYIASHDLQEPLRMVNIYTQLILTQTSGQNAKLAEYSDFVHQGVRRMEALIQDVLTYSRNVHATEKSSGRAELSAALQEAMSLMGNTILEAGAQIEATQLPVVCGEASQLVHVFQNVLSNALKYRRGDVPVRIYIEARRQPANRGMWVISIRDNGIGFEPEYAERIFGLFKRLHKDEYPGTGLGLAICKRILERYGGQMWAEGKPGEGAIFYFSLPAASE